MKTMLIRTAALVLVAACHGSDTTAVEPCGNGELDATESCDPGIAEGADGACPESCDDGDASTVDLVIGTAAACDAVCRYVPIPVCGTIDGFCPPCCMPSADVDCQPACGNGLVEAGETCDGNCPTACDDGNACTDDSLTGDPAACTAACTVVAKTACADGDGCCPTGCSATTDSDCSPRCGNGVVETGEICDGNCPTTCDDGDACTQDALVGDVATCTAACDATLISVCVAGDGCCPAGCVGSADTDCGGGGSAALGDVCSAPSDCASGVCLDDAAGAPGGYCSAACQHDADCGTGNECAVVAGAPGECRKGCASDADCRTPEYRCYDADGDSANECWITPTGSGAIGDACVAERDCTSGVCLPEAEGWPGGTCTSACGWLTCDVGSICVTLGAGHLPGTCLEECDASFPDCRKGYACEQVGGVRACLPDPACTEDSQCSLRLPTCDLLSGTCVGCASNADCAGWPSHPVCDVSAGVCTAGGANGTACAAATDCASGECLAELLGWPGGVCTQACNNTMDCSEGGICNALGVCLEACSGTTACSRPEYVCTDESIPGGMPALVCTSGEQTCTQDEDCPSSSALCGFLGTCESCTGDADCARFADLPVCDPAGICLNARPNGSACSSDTGCAGGTCLDVSVGYDGGYCTQTCMSSADCTFGGHCVADSLGLLGCAQTCTPTDPTECRSGYACIDVDADGIYECAVGP